MSRPSTPRQMHRTQPQAIDEPGHIRGMSPIEYGGGLRRTTMSASRGGGGYAGGSIQPTSRFEPDDEKTAPGQAFAQFIPARRSSASPGP